MRDEIRRPDLVESRERLLISDGVSIVVRVPKGWKRGSAVILAHGAGQGMDSPFMSFFHERLAGRGYLSVKFNFPYMEAGRRAPDHQKKLQTTYSSVVGNVLGEFRPSTLVIGGKSLGGRVSSYIAPNFPQVNGLVFLGYPLHPPGDPTRLRDQHLYEITRPMLFISGTRDALARRELLSNVVGKLGPVATLHWIDGGDHSLKAGKNGPDHLPEAVETIDRWIGRLLSYDT